MNLARIALAFVTLAIASPVFASGTVWIVDDSGGPDVDFTQIRDAVAAAQDGDAIIVRTGLYAGFEIVDKGLVVTADQQGAQVDILTTVVVRDLALGKVVVLRNLDTMPLQAQGIGFVAQNCAGTLWLEECRFVGANPALAGGELSNCTDVLLSRMVFWGGNGGASPHKQGAAGLVVSNSDLVIYDGRCSGGNGSFGENDGANGGPGLEATGSEVRAFGSTLTGGDGGDTGGHWDNFFPPFGFLCGHPGEGGSAAHLTGGGAELRGCTLAPGSSGVQIEEPSECPDPAQLAPPITASNSSVLEVGGAKRVLAIGSPRFENASTKLGFSGPSGEVVVLLLSAGIDVSGAPAFTGSLLLAPPIVQVVMGVVPSNGKLGFDVVIPDLVDPGDGYFELYLQAAHITPTPQVFLGSPSALTIREN